MTPKTILSAVGSLAAVALLATACQDDDLGVAAGSSESISFKVLTSWEQDAMGADSPGSRDSGERIGCDTLVSDDKQDTLYLHRTVSDLAAPEATDLSRADIVTKDKLDKFMVSCVKNNSTSSSYYFQNLEVAKQGSGNFSNASKPYYWLATGAETYDFYAYAPSTYGKVTVADTPCAPQFSYNAAVDENCDLMVAKQIGMKDDEPKVVDLEFEHLLSGIRFKVGADCDEIKISKIEITGLYLSGNCSYDSETDKWEWSNLTKDNSKSLVRTFSPTFDTSADKVIDKTDGEGTPIEVSFFVVPQTITAGDNAKICLTYIDGSEEKVLYAPLIGSLGQGKLVTYAIKVEDDSFEFTVEQEGLHLKFNFPTGKKIATRLTPSIKLKDDDVELIDDEVTFYGSGATPSYAKLAGDTGSNVFYFDGSFFLAKAVERYKAINSSDYCWDASKDIDANATAKTQKYVVTLTSWKGTAHQQEVEFHFDYLEYIYNNTSSSATAAPSYLTDTREGRGNFTIQDATNNKWRNCNAENGSSLYYSDEQINKDQVMSGLSDKSQRTMRVYISSKDVEQVGYSKSEFTDDEQNMQNSLIEVKTPLLKSDLGKVGLAGATKLTTVTADLMAKQGEELKDLSYCFYNCKLLTGLDVSKYDTKKVENMSYMFYYCQNLTSLDVSKFNTSNVTDMSYMFYRCKNSNFKTLNVSNFDTSKVTNMSYMFYYCYYLTSLDVSKFDTSNVTDMSYMFGYCNGLTSLDVSKFNTSNVTNMSSMFTWCQKLTSLDVSKFNTSNVTNMNSLFSRCSTLKNLNVSNFDTSNVTNMASMFSNCGSLTSLDVSNFNTSNVTNMASMFNGCSKLTSSTLKGLTSSTFDTSNVTSMASMFSECTGFTTQPDISKFDTRKVTSMKGMFSYCENLTNLNLDIENFDTSNVTDMQSMFNGCYKLTKITFGSKFDTSNVTNMNCMFRMCQGMTNSTNLGVSKFVTSNVTDMGYMFDECLFLTSLDVSNFDTSNVTNMEYMFNRCERLSSFTLGSNFDTSKVTNMLYMFNMCYVLKNLDLSNFDTSNVTNMFSMFRDCKAMETLKLNNFDTSKVTSMWYMFNSLKVGCVITCKQTFKDWVINNINNLGLNTAYKTNSSYWNIVD